MNKMNRQKFMTIFNDMLNDRSAGTNAILQNNFAGDEVDQLNVQKEQSLKMRLDERNILFLRKVKEAKQKILDGTYGLCEDCGSEISQKRLIARPMACLCIDCQEEKERNEFGTFKKRRDLTAKKFTDEVDADTHIVKREKFNSVKDIQFESVIDA